MNKPRFGTAMIRRSCVLAVLAMLATGCSTVSGWWGDDEALPLEGVRKSVIVATSALSADARVANLQVILPEPYVNPDWPQPGGSPLNVMYHLDLLDEPKRIWTVSAGAGSVATGQLVSVPIIANDKIYVLDTEARVHAFNANSGDMLWNVDLIPLMEEDKEQGFGGGIAYEQGRIFVTTGFGEVVALDSTSGSEIWRQSAGVPIRAAPTVFQGRVYVVSLDNVLRAYSTADGTELWSYQAIEESTGLLGNTSPAVANDIVVGPFNSGELIAFQVQNGRPIWFDTLSQTGRLSSLGELSDISGRPIIDRGLVVAISHANRLAAINLSTGERIWAQNITGVQTPWAAGNFIYLVTTEGQVICLVRDNGLIRWVKDLPRYEDEEDREDVIEWSGPVLAGGRLYLVSSHGVGVVLSPFDGEQISTLDVSGVYFIPPIIANKTLYLLSDDAKLSAYR